MSKALAVLCSMLALGLVAGCGGDDDDNGDSGGGAATPTTEAAPSEPAGTEVVLKDISFQPETITVEKGTKVTWRDEDSPSHDVTKTGGPGPDFKSGPSGGLEKGDTFSFTFDTPGTIDYVCTVHPNMKAKVIVK